MLRKEGLLGPTLPVYSCFYAEIRAARRPCVSPNVVSVPYAWIKMNKHAWFKCCSSQRFVLWHFHGSFCVLTSKDGSLRLV